MKKALVTGASSGIGRDMARYLSKLGYAIIAVARDEEKLEQLKEELGTEVIIIQTDLADSENCKKLYEEIKQQEIEILVNNAGFGDFGEFIYTNLEKEIAMIQTNITAMHILAKLLLQDMVKRNHGYILNVASISGFMPGPLMATYYASKAYIVRLTQGIAIELKKEKSKVGISVLCPGPVKTNFNNVANVKFNLHSLSSEKVATYAIDKMLKRKLVIIPGFTIKCARFLSKIAPDMLSARVCYYMQEKKR